MEFPCLVKYEDCHAIVIEPDTVLFLEGPNRTHIIKTPKGSTNFCKPTVFSFNINAAEFNFIRTAHENMMKHFNLKLYEAVSSETLDIDFKMFDVINYRQSRVKPEPELEWHTEHEVKNTFNQFVPVDVVFEDEKRIWFRYRVAGCTSMQQPVMPATPLNDVHSENLCSIAKSSKHYRVIKKADVTMSECLTQVVADGPVKATLIITE